MYGRIDPQNPTKEPSEFSSGGRPTDELGRLGLSLQVPRIYRFGKRINPKTAKVNRRGSIRALGEQFKELGAERKKQSLESKSSLAALRRLT